MPYFRIDDAFAMHPKIMSLSPEAGWLWVRCGTWCAQNVTDGMVPNAVVAAFGGRPELTDELVEAALWDETHTGWGYHDWADHQFSREQVMEKRASDRERQRQARERAKVRRESEAKNAVTRGGVATESRRDADRESRPPKPNQTKPELQEKKDLSSAEPPRADVEQLCERLRDRIVENGAKTPSITSKWRNEARLLLDKDRRELDKALRLIDWATSDSFWKSNILSMPTFREKYDQLRLKANQSIGKSGSMSASEKVAGWGAIAAQMSSEPNQTQIGA